MENRVGLLAVIFELDAALSPWWLMGAALLGIFVGGCIFRFSSPHRKLKEAVVSSTIFGFLWGAASAVLALIGMNLIAEKTLTVIGFVGSVLAMSLVCGVFSIASLFYAERFQKHHPHRVRAGLEGRLKV